MSGFGAMVKSFVRAFDRVVLGFRLTLSERRRKPCPIPILVEAGRRGR
jgi:hypothetical protein